MQYQLIRIEGRTGFGLFNDLDTTIDWQEEIYNQHNENMPNGNNDKVIRDYLFNEGINGWSDRIRYAYNSYSDIKKYFNRQQVESLLRCGFTFHLVVTEHCIQSNYQSVYEPDKIISRVDITNQILNILYGRH